MCLCLTVNDLNGLGEGCCEEPACLTDKKSKKKQKKQLEVPAEGTAAGDTPLKKKTKKKRKLADAAESPGNSSVRRVYQPEIDKVT